MSVWTDVRGIAQKRGEELAEIFEKASRERTNIIDPPFDCVTLNLKPETCKEIASLIRLAIQ